VKQVHVAGARPEPEILARSLNHHATEKRKEHPKRRMLERQKAMVFRDRDAAPKSGPQTPAPTAGPKTKPVEISPPQPDRSQLRKGKRHDREIDAWGAKRPRLASALAARIGSAGNSHLSVLKDAHRNGPAHLHHVARSMIRHFRESVHGRDWQPEARRALAGEITTRKLAGDKRLDHDLRMLAKHFKVYAQARNPDNLAPDDLEDLKALGEVIGHLLKSADQDPTPAEVKDAALMAFRRDLERQTPHSYLQGKSEGAKLARRIMGQGLQEQTDRVIAALNEVATEHAADVATIGDCRFSNMTQEQSEAACRLTAAVLNKAYDLENDGAALHERFDREALAYLGEAAQLIEGRVGNANLKSDEVREFYADALIVLPLEAALDSIGRDAPTAGIAKIITGVAAWLFRDSEKPPIVSQEAIRDLGFFVRDHRTQARSLLHKMSAG
jgi:hypothetical protein